MANKNFEKTPIKDTKDGNFGNYQENRGGGTPVGGKFGPVNGRQGWHKAGEPGHRDEGQPRTDDGKFTYNAANGKPLKEISKVNGHSRGTTINPVLTGGENGVHFEDLGNGFANPKFDKQKWDNWVKNHTYYRAGSLIAYQGKIKMTDKGLERIAQEWDATKGEFKGENVEDWKNKKGRHSLESNAALDELKNKGIVGGLFVQVGNKPGDKETGIQVSNYKPTNLQPYLSKKNTAQPNTTTPNQASTPAPAQAPVPPSAASKFSSDQINEFKEYVKSDPAAFGIDDNGLQQLLAMDDADISDMMEQLGITA